MRIIWQAWRWYNSRGGPGSWSLDHAFGQDDKVALCGTKVPHTGRIFDYKSGTGQDRCKRCEVKASRQAEKPPTP